MKVLSKVFAGLLSLVMISTIALPLLSNRAMAQADTTMEVEEFFVDDIDWDDPELQALEEEYANLLSKTEVDTEVSTGVAIFSCVLMVLGAVTFIIWVYSLIHCKINAPEDKKIMWILIMFFIPVVSIYYFFTKRKEWGKGSKKAEVKEATKAE